jgi:hypothetical protein
MKRGTTDSFFPLVHTLAQGWLRGDGMFWWVCKGNTVLPKISWSFYPTYTFFTAVYVCISLKLISLRINFENWPDGKTDTSNTSTSGASASAKNSLNTDYPRLNKKSVIGNVI